MEAEIDNPELISFRAAIAERFPELADEPFAVLSAGWDCIALDAGGKLLFKIPRNEAAAARLRKEEKLLGVIRPRVKMAVPDMQICDAPLYSWHEPIPGAHLISSEFDHLTNAARAELAGALAGLYADLHAISLALVGHAGAAPLSAWPSGELLRNVALPLVPANLRERAEELTRLWDGLGPDPYGKVFGHFDGHGWNMAFDHKNQRLNGVYDFGDSGIGALHQEFIYTNFISADLTARVIDEYEALTGKSIDRARVNLLTGVYRLVELASTADAPENMRDMVRNLTGWLEA